MIGGSSWIHLEGARAGKSGACHPYYCAYLSLYFPPGKAPAFIASLVVMEITSNSLQYSSGIATGLKSLNSMLKERREERKV